MEPTLANFTLELVRAYIVALQCAQARELHPFQPTKERPLSDSSISSYVRALRGFSNWLYEQGYVDDPTTRAQAVAVAAQRGLLETTLA